MSKRYTGILKKDYLSNVTHLINHYINGMIS